MRRVLATARGAARHGRRRRPGGGLRRGRSAHRARPRDARSRARPRARSSATWTPVGTCSPARRSPRIPASIAKLYTTATALLRLGPQTTLATARVSDAEVDAAGVLRGDLVLVGGGDPFFGDVGRRAACGRGQRPQASRGSPATSSATRAASTALRSACCTRYDPDLGGVLSALAYDRGVDGGRVRLDAARFAAARFAGAAGGRSACASTARRARGRRRRARARSRSLPSLRRPHAHPLRQRPVEQLRRRDAAQGARRARRRARHDPRRRGRRARRRSASSACARAWPTGRGSRAPTARARATSCGCSSAWTTPTSARSSGRRWRCRAGPAPSSGACAARRPSGAAA